MRLDFDGEMDDEFYQFSRKRYRNAVGETQGKTDSAINLGAPISANLGNLNLNNLNQPTSSGLVGSGVTVGGSTTIGGLGTAAELNQPVSSAELNQPLSSPPVDSEVLVGGNDNSTPPTPPDPPSSGGTFTEGILLGSGLLGATLQNATTPRFGGGAPAAKTDKGEVVFPEGMQPKSTDKKGFIAPLLIGTLVVGSLYLILKGK
jgi:hypothetical protein